MSDVAQAPRRQGAALRATAALALAAMMVMVTGPAMSHHYAESSPYHSHVYLDGTLAGHHSHESDGHSHDAHEADVLSATGNSAAGSGPLHIDTGAFASVTPHLVTNVAAIPAETDHSQAFTRPPEQPPRLS